MRFKKTTLAALCLAFVSVVAYSAAGDRYLSNPTSNKDVVIQVNKAGVTTDVIKAVGSTGAVTVGGSTALGVSTPGYFSTTPAITTGGPGGGLSLSKIITAAQNTNGVYMATYLATAVTGSGNYEMQVIYWIEQANNVFIQVNSTATQLAGVAAAITPAAPTRSGDDLTFSCSFGGIAGVTLKGNVGVIRLL